MKKKECLSLCMLCVEMEKSKKGEGEMFMMLITIRYDLLLILPP